MGGRFLILSFLALSLSLISTLAQASTLRNYQILHSECIIARQKQITLLRSFEMDGQFQGLAVDPTSLQTQILPLQNIRCVKRSVDNSSRYEKILAAATAPPYLQQNDGLTSDATKHVYLTVDLCPSRNQFEAELLNFFEGVKSRLNFALPVAFSLSGDWMLNHASELQ